LRFANRKGGARIRARSATLVECVVFALLHDFRHGLRELGSRLDDGSLAYIRVSESGLHKKN